MKQQASLEQVLEAYEEALGDYEQTWIPADDELLAEIFDAVNRFGASEDGGMIFILGEHRSDLVGMQVVAESLMEEGPVLRVELHEIAGGALLAIAVIGSGEGVDEAPEEDVAVPETGVASDEVDEVPQHAQSVPRDRGRVERRPASERDARAAGESAVDPGRAKRSTGVAARAKTVEPPQAKATREHLKPWQLRVRLRHVPVSITVKPVEGAELRLFDRALVRKAIAGFAPAQWEPIDHRLAPWQHALYCLGAVAVDRSGRLVPTWAGLMTLGNSPRDYYPGAQVVVQQGRDKEVWRGTLPRILRRARECMTLGDVLGEELAERILLHAWMCRLWSNHSKRSSIVLKVTDDGFKLSYPGYGARDGAQLREMADAGIQEIVGALGYPTEVHHTMSRLTRRVAGLGGATPQFSCSRHEVTWKVDWPWHELPDFGADVEGAQPARTEFEELPPPVASLRPLPRRVEPRGESSVKPDRKEPGVRPLEMRQEPEPRPVVQEAAPDSSFGQAITSAGSPSDERMAPPPNPVELKPPSGAERATTPVAKRPVASKPKPAARRKTPAARTRRRRQSRAQREATLLSHLNSHGPQTTRELVAALGWTRSTMRSVLAGLVDSGKVMGESESARSPFQRYAAC